MKKIEILLNTKVPNLWVMIPFEDWTTFHRGHLKPLEIIDAPISIRTSSNIIVMK